MSARVLDNLVSIKCILEMDQNQNCQCHHLGHFIEWDQSELNISRFITCRNLLTKIVILILSKIFSVTRLGDLFDFGQLFKAFGNN